MKKRVLPASQQDREAAAVAAAALRLAIAEPATAGERTSAFIDMSRPRRGVHVTWWSNLPGLSFSAGSRTYQHALLPGWSYTVREMRTEMIEDLDRLAATGERPTTAT